MALSSIPEIALHLGAHRTGSTALQAALREDDALLRERGIVCLTPEGPTFRRGRTMREATNLIQFASNRVGPRRWLRLRAARREIALRASTGVPHRLVISDENLLGPIFHPRSGRALYPAADRALKALRSVLRRDPDVIVLGVRPYDSFLASAYAMSAAYRRNLAPFDTLRQGLREAELGWPHLVRTIGRIFPTGRLEVYPIREGSTEAMRAALLGTTAEGLGLSDIRRINLSPTLEALEAIRAAAAPSKPEIDDLIRQHSDGSAFDPWSNEERALLQERYRKDLATLDLS